MRVDAPLINPENLDPQKIEQSGPSTTRTRPGAVNSGHDQAQLTVDKGRVEQLKAHLSTLPEVRHERVAKLSQAIRNGAYQVNDQQLADAIHSELLAGEPSRH